MMRRFVLGFATVLLTSVLGAYLFMVVGVGRLSAQEPVPATSDVTQVDADPSIVKVGVYVLNIGKLDTATGAFTIDFYLSFSSDEPSNPGNFEFANGRATSVDKSLDEPTDKFYRIQATLASNLDMSRYPFDRHSLVIELEDKEQTTRTQVYQVSMQDSGLDPAVSVVGWNLDGWKAEVNEHYYAPYDTTFSRYVFSIEISRSITAAVLKTILPALTIVLVGLLSLVLAPDKIVPRLTLNTGSLTGAVLFHLNMTASLPPLGYLTFGDRFMLFNYLGLVLTLISTLIALFYLDRKRTGDAERVHKLALAVVPAVWAGLQLLNFFIR